MNCKKVKNLLNDFLEGGLSKGLLEEVQLHLANCPHCQKEKELFSKTWQMLDFYAAPKLKDDFTSSLMKKIHLEQVKIVKVAYKAPQFSFRRLAPILAPLSMLILIFSLFFNKSIYNNNKLTRDTNKLAKASSSVVVSVSQKFEAKGTVSVVSDQEVIENLDILQNMELLDNMNLLSELDIVEDQEAAIS